MTEYTKTDKNCFKEQAEQAERECVNWPDWKLAVSDIDITKLRNLKITPEYLKELKTYKSCDTPLVNALIKYIETLQGENEKWENLDFQDMPEKAKSWVHTLCGSIKEENKQLQQRIKELEKQERRVFDLKRRNSCDGTSS